MTLLTVITTAVAFSAIKRSIIAPALALGILVLVGQVDAQGTGSSFTEQEKAEYLGVHNQARREVGSPPAEWDTTLASEAQQFANFLASAELFKHASEFPEWKRDMGENLAYNFDANPAKQAAEQWLSEKAAFHRLNTNGKLLSAHVIDFNIFKDIGHYTQMVWQDTTKIGGGKAQYTTGSRKGAWIVVGKYSPSGNYQDKYAYGTPNSGSPANNAGPGGGPQAPMNPAQGPDKSTYTQGDTQVTIKVTNNSGQPVAYEWVDYEGKPVPQAPMSTLGVTLFCYPGHLYRFHVGGTATPYRATRDAVQNHSIGAPANNAGPIGGAQATPPSAANQTKSTFKEGDPPVTIFVTNKTGQALEAYWVNYEGEEGKTGVIQAGAEKFQMGTSWPGNLFRFKLNGKLHHTWAIQQDQPHLTIQ